MINFTGQDGVRQEDISTCSATKTCARSLIKEDKNPKLFPALRVVAQWLPSDL